MEYIISPTDYIILDGDNQPLRFAYTNEIVVYGSFEEAAQDFSKYCNSIERVTSLPEELQNEIIKQSIL